MKNKNDVLSALSSQYSINPLRITGLEFSYSTDFNTIIFFTTTGDSSFVIFLSSSPQSMAAANILTNHFNTHPDKTVLLYHRGGTRGLYAEDVSFYYEYT